MPKKKEYTFYYCKECEIDFLVAIKLKRKVNCPKCADELFVEKIRTIWMNRPFNYKRPWTNEEDELILVGVKQGYTHKQISESLNGRTTKAVTRRLQQIRRKLNVE
jgi:DNA-directed RNA polymerase subunit RPC12/RpoP